MNYVFLAKRKLVSYKIQMNALFKNSYGIKIRKYDRNIHKAMKITVDIQQTNKKLFVIVQPKSACKQEFADYLWIPILDQPQSDIVVYVL